MASNKVFMFAGLTFVLIALIRSMNESGRAGPFLVIGLALIAFGVAQMKRKGDSDAP